MTDTGSLWKGFPSKVALGFFVLVIACWAVYSNSLNVPFYLDDVSSITNNSHFLNANAQSLFDTYGLRVIGYLSLWYDYMHYGLDVTPYHITNTIIHMANGALVFVLILLLGKTTKSTWSQNQMLVLAFIPALLFTVHPLQTQAVTYIVQRLASLVTFFYLLSLVGYVGFRFVSTRPMKLLMLLLFIGAGISAVLTKQNAFTLPLVIMCMEVVLFRTLSLKLVCGAALVAGVLLFALGFISDSVGTLLSKIDALSRESKTISRVDYFTVQLPIIWEYLGKIIWPWPLHLEYDYKLTQFSTLAKVAAGVAHVIVLVGAWRLRSLLPLLTFGVFFYYLSHLIESGVVPITDLAFEHRTYLPNVGAFLALTSGLLWCYQSIAKTSLIRQRLSVGIVVIIAALLSSVTWARNQQWLHPNEFYANEVAQAPNNIRAIHNYAEFKLRQGETAEALTLLNRMYDVGGNHIDGVMLNTHLAVLINSKRYDEAIALGKKLLSRKLDGTARSVINSNMGIIYTNLQRYKLARSYFDRAYNKSALPVNSLIAYAYTLYVLNDLKKSSSICDLVLRIDPTNATVLKINEMVNAKLAGQSQ